MDEGGSRRKIGAHPPGSRLKPLDTPPIGAAEVLGLLPLHPEAPSRWRGSLKVGPAWACLYLIYNERASIRFFWRMRSLL